MSLVNHTYFTAFKNQYPDLKNLNFLTSRKPTQEYNKRFPNKKRDVLLNQKSIVQGCFFK